MPPQAIGPAVNSGVTVYYVAPPSGPNVFAAYYANFTAERTEMARQVFQQRLAAMQPQDRSKEIADLYSTAQKHIEKMQAAMGDTSLLETVIKTQSDQAIAELRASTDTGIKQMEIEAGRERARDLPDQVSRKLDQTGALMVSQLKNGEVPAEAIQEVQQMLVDATAGADGSKMSSAQMSAVASRLQSALDAAGLPPEQKQLGQSLIMETFGLGVETTPENPRYGGASKGTKQALAGSVSKAMGIVDQGQTGGSTSTTTSTTAPGGGGGGGGGGGIYDPTNDPFYQAILGQVEKLEAQQGKPYQTDWDTSINQDVRAIASGTKQIGLGVADAVEKGQRESPSREADLQMGVRAARSTGTGLTRKELEEMLGDVTSRRKSEATGSAQAKRSLAPTISGGADGGPMRLQAGGPVTSKFKPGTPIVLQAANLEKNDLQQLSVEDLQQLVDEVPTDDNITKALEIARKKRLQAAAEGQ